MREVQEVKLTQEQQDIKLLQDKIQAQNLAITEIEQNVGLLLKVAGLPAPEPAPQPAPQPTPEPAQEPPQEPPQEPTQDL